MNNQYPPPPPQQQGFGQPTAPQYQQPQQGGWVDPKTVIGGWSAAQYGMQPGKHIEYKVYSQPTAKGGIFKSVKFFKPFQKKNGGQGESDNFSFNMMKELVEKINHFVNNYCEEKGFFVWQPGNSSMGQGNPYPQQQPPPLPQYQQQPQFAPPQYQGHQQPVAPAPGYPQTQPVQPQFAPQPAYPQPQSQQQLTFPQPPPPQGNPWP